MSEYNEVPHTKIPHVNSLNEELRKMIEYGHTKEKAMTERIIDPTTHFNTLTDTLATMTDGELSHMLNYIVRETKYKKSKTK